MPPFLYPEGLEMARKTKTIMNLSDLEDLATKTRNEIYKALKPTIDAANKRLHRQGIDLKLSTKGKSGLELIETAKQAVNVQPKRQPKQPVQASKQRQTTPKQPRQTRVRKQLPDNFASMKRKDLIDEMKPTIDAANKRLKRLQAMETLSPALNSVMQSGGKFSVKGKTRNEILKETSRALSFINMKTSTVMGAKQFEKNFAAKLSNKSKNITNDQRKTLFDSFRKLQQISPVGLNIYGSERLVRMLADEVVDENYSFETTMNKALKELEREYEQFMQEQDDLDPFNL